VENPSNLGFAEGNNVAAQFAESELLVFLNDDTEVEPDWLEKILRPFEEDPTIGIVGCKMVDFYHRDTEIRSLCDIFGYAINDGFPRTPPKQEYHDVFYVPGFSMAIRASLFEALNGFDKSYFMFAEDLDLAWRALLDGWRMVAVCDGTVYHKFGGSTPGVQIVVDGPRPFRTTVWRRELGERNLLTTLLKNYSSHTLVWLLPCYAVTLAAEMVFFLALGRRDVVVAYGRAVIANVKSFRSIRMIRKEIQQKRRIPDSQIMSQMLFGSVKLLQAIRTGFRLEIT
jgi:GT2 family glycosyltransferase